MNCTAGCCPEAGSPTQPAAKLVLGSKFVAEFSRLFFCLCSPQLKHHKLGQGGFGRAGLFRVCFVMVVAWTVECARHVGMAAVCAIVLPGGLQCLCPDSCEGLDHESFKVSRCRRHSPGPLEGGMAKPPDSPALY